MSENLMDGLLSEMNRCREILKMYEEIPEGRFGAIMIRQSLAEAQNAISSNDVIEMLRAYKALKEIQ